MLWISTDAVMYLAVESVTPLGTGFSIMLVFCVALDYVNKDMEELESSITSKIECPIFPIITAICILVVNTTTVCVTY